MQELISSLNPKMVFRALRNVDIRTLRRFSTDYFLERKAIRRQNEEGILRPTSMYLEITTYCPDKCKGCYMSEAEKGNRFMMPLPTARTAVKMARAAGMRLFNIIGGEPITSSTLPLVETILRENPGVSFFSVTNSRLLSTGEAFLKPLVTAHNLSFGLSINGFRETNDILRGNGSFERVVRASALLSSNRCFFGAVITVRPENRVEVTSGEFLEFLVSSGVSYVFYSLSHPSLAEDFREFAQSAKSWPIFIYSNLLAASGELSASWRTRMVYVTPDGRLLNDRRERIVVSTLEDGFGSYSWNDDYLKRFK